MHEVVVLDIEAANLKNLTFLNTDKDITFVFLFSSRGEIKISAPNL